LDIDGRVSEPNALGCAAGLLRCCGQGLPTIPSPTADGLLLASAQSETIQAVLFSSAHPGFCPDPAPTPVNELNR